MLRYISWGQYFHIPTYNLFIGIGICIAMVLLQYDKAFRTLSEDEKHKIHVAVVLTILLGFLGAYSFDALTQQQELFSNNVGLTLLGGIVTGFLVFTITIWVSGMKLLPALNLLTPYFAMAHGFGRLGCFFAGCCFGSPTSMFWGIVFPKGSIPYHHYHGFTPIHPTQLYEAAYAFFMFALFKVYKPNRSFYIYFIGYSIFRFFVEYVRADNRGELMTQSLFSPSQVISLGIFIVCSTLYVKNTRKARLTKAN